MRRIVASLAVAVACARSAHAQPATRMVGRVAWTTADSKDGSLGRAAPFAVDASGRVYVPDPTESVVDVFAADGTFKGKIGRKGGGPGEFNENCCAVIDPKGRLWVRDMGARRYVVFSLSASNANAMPKATPQFVVKMPHFDQGMWLSLSFDAQGNLLDRGAKPGGSDPMKRKDAIFVVDSAGRILRTIDIPPQLTNVSQHLEIPYTVPNGKGVYFYYPPYAAHKLTAHGPSGEFVTAGSGKYEVNWYAPDGRVRRVLRQNVQGPSLTPSEQVTARADLDTTAAQAKKSVAALPFGVPARKPPLNALQFDLEGRLWVRRSVAGGAPAEFDVYRKDGTLAFVAVWPKLNGLKFYGAARGTSAWAVAEGEDDVPYIVKVEFARGK